MSGKPDWTTLPGVHATFDPGGKLVGASWAGGFYRVWYLHHDGNKRIAYAQFNPDPSRGITVLGITYPSHRILSWESMTPQDFWEATKTA